MLEPKCYGVIGACVDVGDFSQKTAHEICTNFVGCFSVCGVEDHSHKVGIAAIAIGHGLRRRNRRQALVRAGLRARRVPSRPALREPRERLGLRPAPLRLRGAHPAAVERRPLREGRRAVHGEGGAHRESAHAEKQTTSPPAHGAVPLLAAGRLWAFNMTSYYVWQIVPLATHPRPP